MSYQEQQMLARRNGPSCHPESERPAQPGLLRRRPRAWIATFRHSGATYIRDATCSPISAWHSTAATDQRLVCVDHEIQVDGVHAIQRCVAVLFAAMYGETTLRATGTYRDELIYERGGWYFTSRELAWDSVPSRHPLVM